MSLSFQTFPQKDVTDEMLNVAATLFSEHYGIWGSATKLAGKRVRVNPKRLRDQYLPEHGDCYYARALSEGRLVGHAITCRWDWGGRRVCWVTQLVVHKEFRNQGIATTLLRLSRVESDDVYGILSSHPFACMAAATSFGDSIVNPPLNFTHQHAQDILKASPIEYVATAVLKGSLFGSDSESLVCGADTKFFVDHGEHDDALNIAMRQNRWPLGNLPEGHEYLLVFPAQTKQNVTQ
ncbi:hypothetical protein CEP54_015683 [Fusarium duplospermum]|uniref:N-acetyltransferase domain-containing protein n=1 Tax=Fusarium duplospermum TaxID=1325734 RepID=A0A428NM74_9HYPO|nr:hypothetical protein CEP54_015683 [Fusarium duplospermum]